MPTCKLVSCHNSSQTHTSIHKSWCNMAGLGHHETVILMNDALAQHMKMPTRILPLKHDHHIIKNSISFWFIAILSGACTLHGIIWIQSGFDIITGN